MSGTATSGYPARIIEAVEQLGVAIIGYGLAGAVFHAPLIAAEPRMRVAAVVTGSDERAKQAQAEHPGVRVYASADELFDDPAGIDLIVIASPNNTHADLALRAIDAGLPVVVDKPFAVTSAEAEAVVAAAEQRNVALSVFQNRRWDNDFRTVEHLVNSGELGDVRRFESRFERWRPVPKGTWRDAGSADEGAGILYDLGSHLIDQALTLFGPVSDVYAELDSRRPGIAADDDVFLALTHANGTRSHLWMSAVTPQLGPRFRILGSTNGFTIDGLDPQEADLRAGRRPYDGKPWGATTPENWGTFGAGEIQQKIPTLDGDYPAFYAQMAAAILDGTPVPIDPRDAIETLRIIEQARGA
ncbi:oxidoreductase [Nocardia camponoti]|uniref:Oxidoreductase n=1 Tax=Nocardia camponoti TaxID=1616106 RepID=A0A917VAI1_9NOCA|nr:oxidoreductase [Nocardia camponoti]